jgi:hypothetical protein
MSPCAASSKLNFSESPMQRNFDDSLGNLLTIKVKIEITPPRKDAEFERPPEF